MPVYVVIKVMSISGSSALRMGLLIVAMESLPLKINDGRSPAWLSSIARQYSFRREGLPVKKYLSVLSASIGWGEF